jgi:hypothetical protein
MVSILIFSPTTHARKQAQIRAQSLLFSFVGAATNKGETELLKVAYRKP